MKVAETGPFRVIALLHELLDRTFTCARVRLLIAHQVQGAESVPSPVLAGYYPWHACVLRGYSSWVCLSVCLSVILYLTPRTSVRLTNDTTYLTGNEGQNDRTVFAENAPLGS
jgi:hypothetical protein